MIRRVAWLVMGVCLALTPEAGAQTPVRTGIHPIDSVTLTQTEFLTGVTTVTTGAPARIGGHLSLPRTGARVAAVVMMHGGSGIRANASDGRVRTASASACSSWTASAAAASPTPPRTSRRSPTRR